MGTQNTRLGEELAPFSKEHNNDTILQVERRRAVELSSWRFFFF